MCLGRSCWLFIVFGGPYSFHLFGVKSGWCYGIVGLLVRIG